MREGAGERESGKKRETDRERTRAAEEDKRESE